MLILKFNTSSKNLPEMSLRLCIDQLANNNFCKNKNKKTNKPKTKP